MLLYTINAPTVFNHVQQERLNRLAKLSKWSMLDVYVIAILAVTVKLGMIATVSIHFGLIAFAVSVTLSMAMPWLIIVSGQRERKTKITSDFEWVAHEAYNNDGIILNELLMGELLEVGSLSVEMKFTDNKSFIDIFDLEHNWQAKGNLEHQGANTRLMLLAHR